MEAGLEAELDDELGYSSKTLRTSFGDVAVSVPRTRKGEFEPQVLKKNQTSISQDIEEKILSMYAKGMTTGDIEAHIQDIYGIKVSDTTVSRITGKILPVAREWQQRPLEAIYAAVDEQAALAALDAFSERWDKKYPKISQSWRANRANLSTYFKYPQEIRKLQRNRRFQPPAAQGDQGQIGVSHG